MLYLVENMICIREDSFHSRISRAELVISTTPVYLLKGYAAASYGVVRVEKKYAWTFFVFKHRYIWLPSVAACVKVGECLVIFDQFL